MASRAWKGWQGLTDAEERRENARLEQLRRDNGFSLPDPESKPASNRRPAAQVSYTADPAQAPLAPVPVPTHTAAAAQKKRKANQRLDEDDDRREYAQLERNRRTHGLGLPDLENITVAIRRPLVQAPSATATAPVPASATQMTIADIAALPARSEWKGYETLDHDEELREIARLERNRRNNGFGLPDLDQKVARSRRTNNLAVFTAAVPAAPAVVAPAQPFVGSRRLQCPSRSRELAPVARDNRSAQVSSPSPMLEFSTDDESVIVLNVRRPAAPAAPAAPLPGVSKYNNIHESEDAEPCNDPHAAELGVRSHCKAVRHCRMDKHRDTALRTCNDCYNATLATMTTKEQEAYQDGVFRTLCNRCAGMYAVRRYPACECLDEMYCCACLSDLTKKLVAANQEAEDETEPGECQWCTYQVDGSERVQVCAQCQGIRSLK